MFSLVTPQLKEMGPAFAVRSESISFMSQPADFYQTLLESVRTARTRIVMCSLYIGVENECVVLVDEVCSFFSFAVSLLTDTRNFSKCTYSLQHLN